MHMIEVYGKGLGTNAQPLSDSFSTFPLDHFTLLIRHPVHPLKERGAAAFWHKRQASWVSRYKPLFDRVVIAFLNQRAK